MKKRIIASGLWIGIFIATVIVAYAITSLYFTKSQTSDFSKKQIFQFDLDTGDGALYSFDADDEWCFLGEDEGTAVNAYGNAEMTVLYPGDRTSALTNQMTMKSISNAEYAGIDDINFTITGYAMGTEYMSTIPDEAWSQCKEIGNIQ